MAGALAALTRVEARRPFAGPATSTADMQQRMQDVGIFQGAAMAAFDAKEPASSALRQGLSRCGRCQHSSLASCLLLLLMPCLPAVQQCWPASACELFLSCRCSKLDFLADSLIALEMALQGVRPPALAASEALQHQLAAAVMALNGACALAAYLPVAPSVPDKLARALVLLVGSGRRQLEAWMMRARRRAPTAEDSQAAAVAGAQLALVTSIVEVFRQHPSAAAAFYAAADPAMHLLPWLSACTYVLLMFVEVEGECACSEGCFGHQVQISQPVVLLACG